MSNIRNNNQTNISKRNKRKPRAPNNPRNRAQFPKPTPYQNRPLARSFIKSSVSGQILHGLQSFVVCEMPLNSPNLLTLVGGLGVITAATSGLSDLASFALGRAEHVTARAIFNSLETVSNLQVYMFLSDTQPSTVITTYPLALSGANNYLKTPRVDLGVLGGMSRSPPMVLGATMKRILRDNEVADDRDFIATLNPVPAAANQTVWLGIVVFNSINAGAVTNGCSVDLEVTVRVKGFSRLIGA